MPPINHDLPTGMTDWIENVGGGRIRRLERHVARREAWVVDVERTDGSVLEGFLRLQRDGDGGVDPRRLERETRIIDALGGHGIPSPEVHGWNADLRCTLFSRDPGRSDIDNVEDATQQRAVMEDFIRIVARMHRLDLDDLGLDDVMQYKPTTARECAMAEVDLIADQWKAFLRKRPDPLTTFGLAWLDRHAPTEVARVSLVQGDTGPVNFMFQGNRVSAVIDWELGHYADPLEDLGNIMVREFWNPSGGLDGLFEMYAQESGFPYDRFRAQYYAVHQNIRGMIPIRYVCENAHPRESVAWYLCYRYIGDRATCEMLSEAVGVPISRPEFPEGEGERSVLADSALQAQRNDVVPGLEDPFAASRARDVGILIECMDRRRRYGSVLEGQELEEWASLLGERHATYDAGLAALESAIREQRFPDEVIVPVLARKAYRDEWLHAPAVALYPERSWSPID